MPTKPTYEDLEQRVRELEQAEFEREQALKALRESEDRYRELVGFSPLPFLVTQEETIVFVNPAAARLFGAEGPDEIVGTTPSDWIHPDFAGRARRRRSQALELGDSLDPMELVLVRQDQAEIVVIANATRISYHGSPALLSVF